MSTSNDGPKEDPRYVHTEAHLETAFEKLRIKLDKIHREESPTFVLFGGQAGAGKSQTIKRARQDNPNLYVVDVDKLREAHPFYAEIQRDYGIEASSYTHTFASDLKDKVVDYLRERGVSFGLETTMNDAGKVVNLVEKPEWKEHGYTIEAYAVAVPRELSEIGVHNRYLHGRNETELVKTHDGQKTEVHKGRFVPEDVRTQQYPMLRPSMVALAQSDAVHAVGVYDRDGKELYAARGADIDPRKVEKAIEHGHDLANATRTQLEKGKVQHEYNVNATRALPEPHTPAEHIEKKKLAEEAPRQQEYGKAVNMELRKKKREERLAPKRAENKTKSKDLDKNRDHSKGRDEDKGIRR